MARVQYSGRPISCRDTALSACQDVVAIRALRATATEWKAIATQQLGTVIP